MGNHTTGAQRYNARMDKIFAKAKENTNNWGDWDETHRAKDSGSLAQKALKKWKRPEMSAEGKARLAKMSKMSSKESDNEFNRLIKKAGNSN